MPGVFTVFLNKDDDDDEDDDLQQSVGRDDGGGGEGSRQRIFVSLQNQTETINNNGEPVWVMFRELKKILNIILAR